MQVLKELCRVRVCAWLISEQRNIQLFGTDDERIMLRVDTRSYKK